MATNLAKAYVQIVPSAEGMKGMIEQAMGKDPEEAGEKAGNSIASKIKNIIVAAGIGKVVSQAFTEGGALEQSLGGIETLYKENADKMKAYAKEAYKTSGVSANAYMENVTSFSASLISSLKGDTSKAADIANRAMQDMSDNSNKFGTNIQDIQNAYQGFAKQNYTMLDNLKLGYGGTKEEMQRLLKDAQKLSGQKYDISNLADVYTAIGVIQDNLDITGTTAKEAATTFSGSFASMKAAAQDFLGNVAIGGDVTGTLSNLITTASTFLFDNAVPMALNIVKGFATALISATPILFQKGYDLLNSLVTGFVQNVPVVLPQILQFVQDIGTNLAQKAPEMISMGFDLLSRLLDGIISAIPILVEYVPNIITTFANIINDNFPTILQKGYDLLKSLVTGFVQNVPVVLPQILQFVQDIGTNLAQKAPEMISMGFDLLSRLLDGIISAIPILVEYVPNIITTFANIINDNFPTILQKGAELIWQLVQGLISAIPTIVANIPQIIQAIVSAFMAFQWLNLGKNIIKNVGDGIKGMVSWIKECGKAIVDGIKHSFSESTNVGVNLVKGLWNGINSVKDWILGKIKGFGDAVLNGLKSFFGIHSPSKVMADEVGKYLPQGIAVGIEANAKDVYDAMNGISKQTLDLASEGFDTEQNKSNSNNDVNYLLEIIIKLLKVIAGKGDTGNDFSDRDFIRMLKSLGVVFS